MLQASYISTRENHLADDLSRNHAVSFLSKVLQASKTPSQVPPGLVTTPKQTGHLSNGAGSSKIFWPGLSPLDKEVIRRRLKAVPHLLQQVQCNDTIPSYRIHHVLLCSLPSRRWAIPTDGKVLLIRGSQPSTITGPPRPS